MAKAKAKQDFLRTKPGWLLEAVVAIVLSYITASLAINSGSLIQYFVTFVLWGLAINRIIKIFHK